MQTKRYHMEDIQKQYDAIFYRKSVRKYQPEPLPMDLLFDLQRAASTLEPLLPQIPYDIQVLTGEKVTGKYAVDAPHYLCFYSKEDLPGARENAGYLLEQMVLLLAFLDLGACWLGVAKPPKKFMQSGDLDFMVMIAFGMPLSNPHRPDTDAFKRKPMEEITDVSSCRDLLEAVRLAPSAMNRQPWYVTGKEGSLLFSRKTPGLLNRKMMNAMSRLDLGIALAHFRLSAAIAGLPLSISLDETQKKAADKLPVPSGYLFAARVTW